MKSVAKLVIIDPDDNYLMMYRTNHPEYGDDPDLPGGMVEEGESNLEAMVREVEEEAGVSINADDTHELFAGLQYSSHDTNYVLYVAHLHTRPEITMSWEHCAYKWLPYEAFVQESTRAVDTYMHMVADVLQSTIRAKQDA